MSTGLDFVRVIDPRVNVNSSRQKTYGIYNSGNTNIWTNFVSTSFNDTVINWSCNPTTDRVYVNRKIFVEVRFRLTFTGTSAGAGVTLLQAAGLPTAVGVNPGTANFDAPRCLGLSQCFSTFQVSMNNDNISTNLNTYSKVYQFFHRSQEDEKCDLSSSPAMPDQSHSLNDLVGSNLNPLGSYGDNVVQCPRGGFSGAVITRNDSTGAAGDIATVELVLLEPIWMSPFEWGSNQESLAFNMIRTCSIQATLGGKGSGALSGLAAALWSHAPMGSALTSVTANVLNAVTYFNYINPDMTQSLPDGINYSYIEPTLYPTSSLAAVAVGTTGTYTMNNINLPSIPNCMYIWVSERDQDFNITKSDASFFRLDRINIQFGSQDGYLSNARSIDLYHMSRRNGLNLSYDQWILRTGGILCVRFGPDLALNSLEAPGLGMNVNLSMNVTATNIGSGAVVPCLNVLVMQEGVMSIMNGSIFRSVGILTQETVLASKEQTPIPYMGSKNVYGSGFWDDVGSFFKKLVRPAITAAQQMVPAQFQPLVSGASDVAKSYGLGYGKKIGGGRLLMN
jgi:hypothetical protein